MPWLSIIVARYLYQYFISVFSSHWYLAIICYPHLTGEITSNSGHVTSRPQSAASVSAAAFAAPQVRKNQVSHGDIFRKLYLLSLRPYTVVPGPNITAVQWSRPDNHAD